MTKSNLVYGAIFTVIALSTSMPSQALGGCTLEQDREIAASIEYQQALNASHSPDASGMDMITLAIAEQEYQDAQAKLVKCLASSTKKFEGDN
jgi:hypothetical protein